MGGDEGIHFQSSEILDLCQPLTLFLLLIHAQEQWLNNFYYNKLLAESGRRNPPPPPLISWSWSGCGYKTRQAQASHTIYSTGLLTAIFITMASTSRTLTLLVTLCVLAAFFCSHGSAASLRGRRMTSSSLLEASQQLYNTATTTFERLKQYNNAVRVKNSLQAQKESMENDSQNANDVLRSRVDMLKNLVDANLSDSIKWVSASSMCALVFLS